MTDPRSEEQLPADDATPTPGVPDEGTTYDAPPADSAYETAGYDGPTVEDAHPLPDEPATAVEEQAPVVPAQGRKEHKSFLRELPVLVLIAFVLALLIKHFLVQAFYIPSGSMEQTLQVGDRVLVNKVPYAYRSPHRGEIVVFNGLDNFDEGVQFVEPTNPVAKALRSVSSAIGLGAPNEKDYIKRVIAVAGDRVMCCDSTGRVVVTTKEGEVLALDESYVYQPDTSSGRYFCQAVFDGQPKSADTCPPGSQGVLVPEGRLWVMGDHRSNSSDSRAHLEKGKDGTVPEDKVIGKAFTVVFPFGHAGFLRVPDTFAAGMPAAPYVLGAVGTLPIAWVRRRRGAAGRS